MANERADGLDMRYVHPVRHTFFPQSASIPGRAARRLHAYYIRCLRLLIRRTQVLCWSAVDEIPPACQQEHACTHVISMQFGQASSILPYVHIHAIVT